MSWMGLIKLLLVVTSPIWGTLLGMILMVVLQFFRYRVILKKPVPKSEFPPFKKLGIFYRLWWQFPISFIEDFFNRDPDQFNESGLHMICGEQGSGKTTAVVALLSDLRRKYPKVKVRTNMSYLHQDGEISHWKDLVKNENGIYGQVEVLDEIQTWFSSLQSKDFPPEMITEISQQRKQRKMIVGTAQVFSRIAKPIREQTTVVYLPITIFGCLTIVRKSKPKWWDDEKQEFKRYFGTYFFVHTKEIREAFDTYEKIEKYTNEGFKKDVERIQVV